jgi:hypothetical protein
MDRPGRRTRPMSPRCRRQPGRRGIGGEVKRRLDLFSSEDCESDIGVLSSIKCVLSTFMWMDGLYPPGVLTAAPSNASAAAGGFGRGPVKLGGAAPGRLIGPGP